MKRNRRKTAGFTLIEVLIASVIVAMVTAGLGASLHVAFKARRSANDGLSTVRAARIALDAFARDLQSAQPPTGVLAGAFTGTADTGTSGSVTFFGAADPSQIAAGQCDLQQITLTVVGVNDVQAAAGTSSVTSGSTNSFDGVLVRRAKRSLLAPVDETLADQVLCRHVRSLTLRYYDGSQWYDTWDSTGTDNTLPLAVEVTLEITTDTTSPTAQTYSITRMVHLPCGTIATTTSTTAATPTTP